MILNVINVLLIIPLIFPNTLMIIVNMIFNLIIAFEYYIAIKIYSFKYILYNNIALNLYLVINISGVLIGMYNIICSSDLQFYSLVIISLRVTRVIKLLSFVEEYSFLFQSLAFVKKLILSLFYCLYSFFYLFTTISILLLSNKEVEMNRKNYYTLNFNDFTTGIITCFSLTVVTNWSTISLFREIYGRWISSYFYFYYFISINFILKLIHVFILDVFIEFKKSFIKQSSSN